MRKLMFPLLFLAVGFLVAASVAAQNSQAHRNNGHSPQQGVYNSLSDQALNVPLVDYSPPPSPIARNDVNVRPQRPVTQLLRSQRNNGYEPTNTLRASTRINQAPEYKTRDYQYQTQETQAPEYRTQDNQDPQLQEFSNSEQQTYPPIVQPSRDQQTPAEPTNTYSNQMQTRPRQIQQPARDDVNPANFRTSQVMLPQGPVDVWRKPPLDYPARVGELFPPTDKCDEWSNFCKIKPMNYDCECKRVCDCSADCSKSQRKEIRQTRGANRQEKRQAQQQNGMFMGTPPCHCGYDCGGQCGTTTKNYSLLNFNMNVNQKPGLW